MLPDTSQQNNEINYKDSDGYKLVEQYCGDNVPSDVLLSAIRLIALEEERHGNSFPLSNNISKSESNLYKFITDHLETIRLYFECGMTIKAVE